MGKFADASMIQRRQILEEALADVLRPVGEIMHNADGERCLAVRVMLSEHTGEWQLTPLWQLACALEVKLS